ncbi:MAG: threonine synthase, partial [Lachnospiraceae bacterium]|nr:threonine synthase [Lachnospiraceae bacterium]
MLKYVTGARCTLCGAVTEAVPDLTVCPKCGGILDIEYDYEKIRKDVTAEDLASREDRTMWHYREFLPVEEHAPEEITRLKVGNSPLYKGYALASA